MSILSFFNARLANAIIVQQPANGASRLNPHITQIIITSTGATSIQACYELQSLWSGYGSILRASLQGKDCESVIVKHIDLSVHTNHPRGWNSSLSHQRKLRSYQVESAWYHYWSQQCPPEHCKVPRCLAVESCDNTLVIVLEDLDATGFNQRRNSVTLSEAKSCLKWLANFHAQFLGVKPEGLWPTGTYWHLETRPDELDALTDIPLKYAAGKIDQRLRNSPYQTLVHGDAKLANFCFSADGKNVAAVDFQYVGGGCGMKDVAYFIGSCFHENDCARLEDELLTCYFTALRTALDKQQKPVDANALEADWRSLYPVAWTDFHRFIKGWSPGHWKIHGYSEQLARRVVAELKDQ